MAVGNDRRTFLASVGVGTAALTLGRIAVPAQAAGGSQVHRVHHVPVPDFTTTNRHPGVESLLFSLAAAGIRFYKSASGHPLGAADGIIGQGDTILLKVNAQWKYRGCTNSDVVRGVIQRILDHPDGFTGEVVMVCNGQDRGSLNCDTMAGCDGGTNEIHANAENERHSFSWLNTSLFRDARVGERLLDPIRTRTVGASDHTSEGYRTVASTSYPCFNTPRGTRVELREGIWTGAGYDSARLKYINIPVLKDHKDLNLTACTKHMYGLFTTHNVPYYFHDGVLAGRNMADFHTLVRPMALNILDCIWLSHASLCGYPPSTTTRTNMLVGGLDPIAVDAWAARNVMLPVSGDPAHDPDLPGLLNQYLSAARDGINAAGGLNGRSVTMDERQMSVRHQDAREIQLNVWRDRGETARARLAWAGGRRPFRVERDVAPHFPRPRVLADALDATDFVDETAAAPALYYRVIGS